MPESDQQIMPAVPAEIQGDPRELLTNLGASEALPGISAVVAGSGCRRVHDLGSLDDFLRHYITDILIPLELPAVLSAWQFTEENHVRELIELDRELLQQDRLKPFRESSCAVGRRQLAKLRPLRDHRVIQRYWTAMDGGQAAAWHTLVFGIVTSVYSIPLRQGLVQLAQQTLAGFSMAAATDHQLPLPDCRDLLQGHLERLPEAINGLIRKSQTSSATVLFSGESGLAIAQ